MDTKEANQLVHGALAASDEYDKSPHFFPENIAYVTASLKHNLSKIFKSSTIDYCLDLGCGTGFMYPILKDIGCANYLGIDITTEMLDCFKGKFPNVSVQISSAESIAFQPETFSLVTNYSFLDHIDELFKVFREAYRVLKDGGVFYSGLVPNKEYAKSVLRSYQSGLGYSNHMTEEFLSKEYTGIYQNGSVYQDKYGLPQEILEAAEPQKTREFGLCPVQLTSLMKEAGFKQFTVVPNWFFRQAYYKNSPADLKVIEDYLSSIGPFALPMFKYFDIYALK